MTVATPTTIIEMNILEDKKQTKMVEEEPNQTKESRTTKPMLNHISNNLVEDNHNEVDKEKFMNGERNNSQTVSPHV